MRGSNQPVNLLTLIRQPKRFFMRYLLMIFVLASGLAMCNSRQGNDSPAKPDDEAGQKNKMILVRTVFEELIGKRNLAAIDSLYDKKMVDHGAWEGQEPGLEGFRRSVKDFIEMFPDLQVTVDNMIVAGDRVATKDSWKGTHAASGKLVTGETMHVFKVVNGKITDEWSNGWEWLEGL